MSTRDKRIDAYIAKAPDFARPILTHFRALVHATCPEVEETMKWNSPTFMYAGSMMCGMAAFKEHCRIIFWKGELIEGAKGGNANVEALGKPRKVSDLPPKRELVGYIKQAMKLNEQGVKMSQARQQKPAAQAKVPDYFMKALRKNSKALQNFEAFSPSHRREYVEWITEAKREETRDRRIARAIEWIAEGKGRNWKYMNSKVTGKR